MHKDTSSMSDTETKTCRLDSFCQQQVFSSVQFDENVKDFFFLSFWRFFNLCWNYSDDSFVLCFSFNASIKKGFLTVISAISLRTEKRAIEDLDTHPISLWLLSVISLSRTKFQRRLVYFFSIYTSLNYHSSILYSIWEAGSKGQQSE